VPSSETEIANLLHRYAELLDTGDSFEPIAELFAHAQLRVRTGDRYGTVAGASIADLFEGQILRYPDGLLHTKHVTTNLILEVDEAAGTAAARSYYTLFQQVDDFPLQVILTGRYHDTFERVDGTWRFASRDYSLIDQVGDLSRHLRQSL
jgi:3-phenylpropionate/cinnamic acid dioxygenase small subunit